MMTTNRPLALVTGASSGIGAELAVGLARSGHDLILTGRDQSRLDAVAQRVGREGAGVECLVVDLEKQGVGPVLGLLGTRPLAVLVNNAGLGGSGPVAEADPGSLATMIDLNVKALTLLTRALVPGMVARGSGRILNVGSTASFGPIPGMAVYAATKAFVLSFGDALAEELRGTGVTVTTLCPGPTATRFAERADLGTNPLFRSAMSAEVVAAQGLKALFRGRRSVVTGLSNQLMAASTRLVPRWLAARVAGRIMGR